MTVKLNHTIVMAHDHEKSALFLTELLGLDAPIRLGPFAAVTVGDALTLDFMKTDGDVTSQHYAFLVSEAEFDAIFARIKARNLPYLVDSGQSQRNEINRWDDGRGVYFEDSERAPARDPDALLWQRRHLDRLSSSARGRETGAPGYF